MKRTMFNTKLQFLVWTKTNVFFSYLNQDVRTTEGYWVGMARWVDFSTLYFRVCVCRIHAPKYSENFQNNIQHFFLNDELKALLITNPTKIAQVRLE